MSSLSFTTNSAAETQEMGERIGRSLRGSETLELISDVGGGKTELTRGVVRGAGSSDQVASPTFTISRIYQAPKMYICHFDFYRLPDPGLMSAELEESIANESAVVIVEWSDVVSDVLPDDRLQIRIVAAGDETRKITIDATGTGHMHIVENMQ